VASGPDLTLSRRTALKALGAVPAAAGLSWTVAEAEAAQQAATAARQAASRQQAAYAPKFFTAAEWTTVQLLADVIIPRDERSGSATDAGVPEFMDFMMIDQPERQAAMRGGLRWLDHECRRRFDRDFAGCTAEGRMAVVEDIAWPNNPKPGFTQGTAFFTAFRDLTASGFWTSRMGMEDLRYMGNRAVPEWTGCPPEALRHLGLAPASE
jgi:gluconate 2-dehydrogenase gamma chain